MTQVNPSGSGCSGMSRTSTFLLLLLLALVYSCVTNSVSYYSLQINAYGIGVYASMLFSGAKGLVSAIVGVLLTKRLFVQSTSKKGMLIAGIWITGIATICLGSTDQLGSGTWFLILSVIFQLAASIGFALVAICALRILAENFQDDVKGTMVLVAVSLGTAYFVGPAVAAFMHASSGFMLPNAVLGLSTITLGAFVWRVLKTVDTHSLAPSGDDPFDVDPLFSSQLMTLDLYLVVISAVISFFQNNLEPHLRPMLTDHGNVGLFFLISAATFLCFGFFVKKLVDTTGSRNRVLICAFGLAVQAIGFILIGPAPMLAMNKTVWLSIAAVVLMGFGFAFSFIPTFALLFDIALPGTRTNSTAGGVERVTYATSIAVIWFVTFSIGDFFGAIVGGFTVDTFGFPAASVTAALVLISTSVILSALNFANWERRQSYENLEAAMATSGEKSEVTIKNIYQSTSADDFWVAAYTARQV